MVISVPFYAWTEFGRLLIHQDQPNNIHQYVWPWAVKSIKFDQGNRQWGMDTEWYYIVVNIAINQWTEWIWEYLAVREGTRVLEKTGIALSQLWGKQKPTPNFLKWQLWRLML